MPSLPSTNPAKQFQVSSSGSAVPPASAGKAELRPRFEADKHGRNCAVGRIILKLPGFGIASVATGADSASGARPIVSPVCRIFV